MKAKLKNAASGALCGAFTFFTVFLLTPSIASGILDFLWIAANLIISCAGALFIFEKLIPAKAHCVFLSLFMQLALLLIFADPVSDLLGFDPNSAFGGLELLGFAVPWIFGTTAAQFAVLLIFRKLCKGKELHR